MLVLLILALGMLPCWWVSTSHITLNKPSKTTFALIRLINGYYYLEAYITAFSKALGITTSREIEVAEIITYPMKSCKGVTLPFCLIDEFGLKYDRMYMLGVWDGKRFRSVNQRECPKLALCTMEIVDDQFKFSWPRCENPVFLPTEMSSSHIEQLKKEEKDSPVHLWEVAFNTFVLNVDLPEELFEYAKLPEGTKILYSPKGKFVKTNLPKPLKSIRSTRFQEYWPLLLMAEEDLTDLNRRLQHEKDLNVSFANFRPNIVVRGVKPYEIDNWNKIEIGGHKWLIVSKCPRCTIPNIDADTGIPDQKHRVSKELARYRRCDPGAQFFAFLGVHGIQLELNHELKVNDKIILKQKAINYYQDLE